MTRTGWVIGSVLGILAVVAGGFAVAFRSDMNAAYERVRGKTVVLHSPYGALEYSRGGAGTDVLVIHGSGGGFDQGELVAQAVLDDRFHSITPSRFGYLGSDAPADATHDDQAHAYAWLLDHLGIERVAVIGLSAGGPSALVFSLLYPERVSSLTLLSAGVTAVGTDDQADADRKGAMLVRLFRHDFPYWFISRLFRKQVMTLMGAEGEVLAGLNPEQRAWIAGLVEQMNPVSPRYEGVVFDNRTPLPGARIAGIDAPTLVVHAEDDTLQLFENAAFADATIPDSRLLRFARGGHFVVIIEQETVRAEVQRHILGNEKPPPE